jgi:hypothetical protein
VGLIAERLYGFPRDSPAYQCRDGQPIDSLESKAGKAESLGNAMLVCMVVPWTLCLAIYTLLHWTYPRDRRLVQEHLPLSVPPIASVGEPLPQA